MGKGARISDTDLVTSMPSHPRTCAGCLGNGKCWICLGTGYLGPDRDATCHRCAGSGHCTEGEPPRAQDVPSGRRNRKVVLLGRRATAREALSA